MRFLRPVEGELRVREDRWGSGYFGMPRGTKPDGSKKYHDGVDIEVVPGENVFSPIFGNVEKVEYPYRSDPRWTGIQIANDKVRVELWYMSPLITAGEVKPSERIGITQDISLKYTPREDFNYVMKPHIHMRVSLLPFTALANGKYVSFAQYVDPLLFLGV